MRTSNAGARDLQDIPLGDQVGGGRRLYEHVATLASEWNEHHNWGLVVGATYAAEAARIRALCPEPLILAPGVGAQAGDLEATVRACLDASGRGLLVNASRGVLYASRGADYAAAARAAAASLRDQINAARRAATTA